VDLEGFAGEDDALDNDAAGVHLKQRPRGHEGRHGVGSIVLEEKNGGRGHGDGAVDCRDRRASILEEALKFVLVTLAVLYNNNNKNFFKIFQKME